MSHQTTQLVNSLLELALSGEYANGEGSVFVIEPLIPPKRGRKQLYQLTVCGKIFTAFKIRKVDFNLWDWESVD